LNLSALRLYTRDLTGVYATDLVPDSLLDRWLNEAVAELYRLRNWSWAPTTLVTGTDVPTFDAQFHSILAYRTSIKVLSTQSDDTKRGEMYTAEYSGLVASMIQFYFPAQAAGLVSNRGNIRQQVRDLSGTNGGEISDAMINQWINESYNFLSHMREWDWLELVQEFSVSGSGPYALTTGTRKVLSVQLTDAYSTVEEVFERPDIVNVRTNRRFAYYDITTGGSLTLAPADRFDNNDEVLTLRVRYTAALTNLTSDASVPAFAAQFYPVLAYGTAIKALQYTNGDKARLELCSQSYVDMIDNMITFYELSHDDTAFQIGINGRDIQQYRRV